MSEATKLELKNPQDGLVLNAKEWSPAEGSDKNALVVIVHGFGESIEDYESFAKELSSNGYRVVAFDQRGFGKTARTRKDYGISNEYYVFEDLDAVLTQVTKGFEGHVILFGHSMGGAITLNYLVKGKLRERIDSFVVTGPFVETHPYTGGKGINKLMLPFMPLVVKFFPKLRRVAAMDANVLSHDPEVVKEIAPQANRRFLTSAQLMNDCIVRGKRLENSVFVGKAIDRPVLVCHGTADKVTDINATRTFCSLLKVKKSRFLEYDGAYHALYRETPEYRDKFLADLYKFLGEVQDLPTHYVAPKPEEETSAKETEETEAKAADKTEDKTEETEAVAESSKAVETEAAAPVAVPEPEAKEPVVESKEPVVESKEPVVESKEPVVESKEPVVEPKETAVESKEPEPESVAATSEPVTEEIKEEVPAKVEEPVVEQTEAVEEKPAETVETAETEAAETAKATETTDSAQATEAAEAPKATEVEEQASKDELKPETAGDAKEASEEPSGEDTPEPESQEDKPAEQKTTTGGGSASKKKNNKKKNKKKGKK
uniref:ARAD1D38346p n=1 Tax=Blastobotrys adeninivorans TaxID=409370 RepID=A0A060TCS8_BLAAD